MSSENPYQAPATNDFLVLNQTILTTLLAFVGALLSSGVLAKEEPSIGYATVAAAMDALLADPAAEVREESGWTIVDTMEGDDLVTWTFTSPGHAAHPAAIKRIVSRRDGAVVLEMRVLCEAEQEPCDELVAEFQTLNDIMRQRFRKTYPAPGEN